MHIKRDISIWNLEIILNVLNRIPGFRGRSKRVYNLPVECNNSNLLDKMSITNGVGIVGKQ